MPDPDEATPPTPTTPTLVDLNSEEGQRIAAGGEAKPPAPPAKPAGAPPAAPAEGGDAAVGAGGNKIEGEALTVRLARERNRTLKELYGTDDPAQIETIKAQREKDQAELARLRRIEEARVRTRQTAEQRAQQEQQQKDQRIQQLEQELQTTKQSMLVSQQDQKIAGIAAKYVKPERLKYANRDLAEHLTELSKTKPKELKKFDEAKLNEWFTEYVAQNPDFALTAAPPTEPAAPVVKQPVEPRRRPLEGAKPPPQKPPTTIKEGEKTVKPGPNQMNRSELAAHLAKQGKRLPY